MKGIIKILDYSSVMDINQRDAIFFAIIVTSDLRGDLRKALHAL